MMFRIIVNDENITYDDNHHYYRRAAAKMTKDWNDVVKGLLKGELKRRNMSYKELAQKLAALGVKDSERNIANKISRGSFTAVFLIQCLKAIDCSLLRLED